MIIEEILHHFEPGDEMTVLNEPFSLKSKAVITLDGGDIRHWLFADEEKMLAISPDDEEIIFLRLLDEEVEPQDGIILIGGTEYEFSYEDSGVISKTIGELNAEEEDRIAIADYESENGEILRTVTNENNGEKEAYLGKMVVEDDILKV